MTWIIKIAADLIHVLIDFCFRLENSVAYLQYSTCTYRFLLTKHNEMKNALFLILKDTRNQIFKYFQYSNKKYSTYGNISF